MTTTKTSKKREFFDAALSDAKMIKMIENLRKQKPGQLVGMVGKKDVLAAQRAELQKLVSEGYSVLQIAEAMKNDVFEILPKSITEVIENKEKKPRVAKKIVDVVKKKESVTPSAATTTTTLPLMKKQVTQIGDAS